MGMSGASDQLFDIKTTSTGWAAIYTATLSADRTFIVHADINAYAPGSGDGMQTTLRAMVRRDSGAVGAVFSTVYDLLNTQKTLGALLWDVRVRLTSTDAVVEVRGGSGNTFWRAEGTAYSFQDDSF